MKTSYKIKNKIQIVLCLFLFTLSTGSALAAVTAKELTIALNSEFETLNPIVNSMMAAIYIMDATLRPVVALTPAGLPKPILIKDIPSLKNRMAKLTAGEGGQKGLRAEIEFLPDLKWGDGTPVTCLDMAAAWQIGKSELVSAPNRVEFLNIREIKIDKANPKKCSVEFVQARWDFFLNFPKPVPAHLELKVFEKNNQKAQDYERNSLYIKDVTNPGLYNGAYRVSELKLGSHIILTPNPHFSGTKPFFEKVIFKFILNTSTLESNLRAGGVAMASSSGLTFDQALAFEKKVKAEKLPFEVLFVPGVIYSHMDFNMTHPALKDVRVRQALAHAFNREEMVAAFFEGRQKAALHFSTELDSWYTDKPNAVKIYDYSKVKAQKLLEQAGWKLGADGYRSKDGAKLTLTISGAADNKLNEMLQSYLQAAWKQVGVELKVKNYPARVLFSEIVRKRNFELALYSFVNSPDASQRTMLHSAMIPSEANSWSGSNRPGWSNKKVDQWLDQVDAEFDSKKRVVLMRKILKAYTEELPALPLYYRSNNSVVPVGMKNYHMSGHVFSEYLDIENWSLN